MKTKLTLLTLTMITGLALAGVRKVGDVAYQSGKIYAQQGTTLILEKTANGQTDTYVALENAPAGLVSGKHFGGKCKYLGTFTWKQTAVISVPIEHWDCSK